MIYGQTTSVKNIIAKVYQDLQLKEEELFTSFLEWSAEALNKIGAVTQLQTKTIAIKISNYRGDLPNDFMYPTGQIMFNGIALAESSTDFPILSSTTNQFNKEYTGFDRKKILEQVLVVGEDRKSVPQYSYKLHNGCIKTTFDCGTINMSYKALPLDDEGYPLIPDYEEFRSAVYWYIVMKYTYPMWRRGEIRDAVYQDAKTEWNWACQSAANKAMIPDLAMLENIKRSYLSLKPNINQFQSFFNNLNSTTN